MSRSPTVQPRLGRGLAVAAAEQRVDAGEQLGEGERLDEIIVGSLLQPVDAIVDRAERGQHQHRRRHACGAQRAQHRQAVEPGQHAIEDDEIELRRRRRGTALRAPSPA